MSAEPREIVLGTLRARLPGGGPPVLEGAMRLSADLGLDSMALVEVLFALEEAFDLALPLDGPRGGARDPADLTVDELVGRVEQLLGRGG